MICDQQDENSDYLRILAGMAKGNWHTAHSKWDINKVLYSVKKKVCGDIFIEMS